MLQAAFQGVEKRLDVGEGVCARKREAKSG